MRAATALSVLAIVGSTLAAPAPEVVKNVHVVYETVVHTIYATEGYAAPTPAPKPSVPSDGYAANPPAPKPTTEAYQAPPKPTTTEAPPKPTTTEAYQAPPEPTTEAPKPTQAPPAPAGSEYMDVVNEWRDKMGMPVIKQNKVLEANAADCVSKGNGEMKHLLNKYTNGQVLAPGEPGKEGFEKVFVGGWLCEMPGMSGLNGICDSMSKGWAYMGQTGHAEILADAKYKTIGCALSKGIWACDLSYDDPTDMPSYN